MEVGFRFYRVVMAINPDVIARAGVPRQASRMKIIVVVVDQPHKIIVLIETISDLYGPAGPHPNNCPIPTGFLATLNFLDTSDV